MASWIVCECFGICAVVKVVAPTLPESVTAFPEANSVLNATLPPVPPPVVPDTTRRVASLTVVCFVQPVGAAA